MIVNFHLDHRLSVRNSSFFDIYNDESILSYPATQWNARNFSWFFPTFCHLKSNAIIAHQYKFSIKSQWVKYLFYKQASQAPTRFLIGNIRAKKAQSKQNCLFSPSVVFSRTFPTYTLLTLLFSFQVNCYSSVWTKQTEIHFVFKIKTFDCTHWGGNRKFSYLLVIF